MMVQKGKFDLYWNNIDASFLKELKGDGRKKYRWKETLKFMLQRLALKSFLFSGKPTTTTCQPWMFGSPTATLTTWVRLPRPPSNTCATSPNEHTCTMFPSHGHNTGSLTCTLDTLCHEYLHKVDVLWSWFLVCKDKAERREVHEHVWWSLS